MRIKCNCRVGRDRVSYMYWLTNSDFSLYLLVDQQGGGGAWSPCANPLSYASV